MDELMVKMNRLAVLGKGSYGVVFLAEVELSSQTQTLAVKTADAHSSLLKEERIYQSLGECPQIVHCYGGKFSWEINDECVLYNLLLEYAPRGTLRHFIRTSPGRKLVERQVREFTREILEGLRFIHSKGYVHCDLKPGNILVFRSEDEEDEKYYPKLADFGVAKEPYLHLSTDDDTGGGVFRGTEDYMSPESYAMGMIEAPLDIWSLGCVVYEMFTGKRVWRNHDIAQVLVELHNWGDIKEPYRIIPPPNVSDDAIDFLFRCLEPEPFSRWTASMLLDHPFVAPEIPEWF